MQSFRLLTKTTLIYLVFIALTFFVSVRYLTVKSDSYINTQTEGFFEYRQAKLQRMAERHQTEIEERLHEMHGLKLLTDADSLIREKAPYVRDTLILNQEKEEVNMFRLKTIIVDINGKSYAYTMRINIEDFTKLRADLLESITKAFFILALVITLFSLFLSGFLLRPFYRILEQMNLYKVGKGIDEPLVKTSTSEFKKMQSLFRKMVCRTEEDYRKLKEYTENMAHEIQTPLAIIRNKTENLIADSHVMEAHTSTVKAIYDEANHLSNLGTTLNLLTKIENGEYSNVVTVSTQAVIERHVDAVKELVGLKALSIETNLNQSHSLDIDPFLFDILLKNLLRNAIRYGTNAGSITISTTSNTLTISNYGEPLSVKPERIFERFYSSNTSSSSLGLGLSLVKRICDLNQLEVKYSYANGQHIFSIENARN